MSAAGRTTVPRWPTPGPALDAAHRCLIRSTATLAASVARTISTAATSLKPPVLAAVATGPTTAASARSTAESDPPRLSGSSDPLARGELPGRSPGSAPTCRSSSAENGSTELSTMDAPSWATPMAGPAQWGIAGSACSARGRCALSERWIELERPRRASPRRRRPSRGPRCTPAALLNPANGAAS